MLTFHEDCIYSLTTGDPAFYGGGDHHALLRGMARDIAEDDPELNALLDSKFMNLYTV